MVKTARNLTVLGIGLSVSAIVGWLLLRENKRAKDIAQVTIKSQSRANANDLSPIMIPIPDEPASPESAEDTAAQPDDLTQINDIGPRFAEALAAAGITRFEHLAEQTPEALADLLAPYISVRSQRIRSRNWIGQAAALAQRQ